MSKYFFQLVAVFLCEPFDFPTELIFPNIFFVERLLLAFLVIDPLLCLIYAPVPSFTCSQEQPHDLNVQEGMI